MAHVIGVNGLRKITTDMVDDAMTLMKRAKQNIKDAKSKGEADYRGRFSMKGVATLDKDNNIGIVARIAAPAAVTGGPDADVSADIGLHAKSTGDAEVEFEVIVTASMDEATEEETE